MSRQLLSASPRLYRVIRANQLFVSNVRQLASVKKPPNQPKPTKPKCPGDEKPKPPKPGYFPSGGTHAVLSDLPMPEGDFMKEWNAKNSKYNMVMFSGLAALIGSIALGIASGAMELYFFTPEYPYTEEELEEFDNQEERKQEEEMEREERHQEAVESKEMSIRRRNAKAAMAREVELMQKDLDEGISDAEMDELKDLALKREEFDKWEAEEEKRLKEVAKEKEKLKKEKEKMQKEKEKEKAKAKKAN